MKVNIYLLGWKQMCKNQNKLDKVERIESQQWILICWVFSEILFVQYTHTLLHTELDRLLQQARVCDCWGFGFHYKVELSVLSMYIHMQ